MIINSCPKAQLCSPLSFKGNTAEKSLDEGQIKPELANALIKSLFSINEDEEVKPSGFTKNEDVFLFKTDEGIFIIKQTLKDGGFDTTTIQMQEKNNQLYIEKTGTYRSIISKDNLGGNIIKIPATEAVQETNQILETVFKHNKFKLIENAYLDRTNRKLAYIDLMEKINAPFNSNPTIRLKEGNTVHFKIPTTMQELDKIVEIKLHGFHPKKPTQQELIKRALDKQAVELQKLRFTPKSDEDLYNQAVEKQKKERKAAARRAQIHSIDGTPDEQPISPERQKEIDARRATIHIYKSEKPEKPDRVI